jgi:hypothetical protein
MHLVFFTLLLITNIAWAEKSESHSPLPGVVASKEVEYGVMMTIKGKTSISRFTDNDRNVTCYVSHKHKTDEVIAMSCVPLGAKK